VRTQEQIRQDLVARQQELRELYTYNPSGTSEGDANVAFTDWFYKQLGKDGSAFDKLKQEEVTLDYPRQACPLKQSRRAVVGVVVDAENKIVGEPKVLQSSGYRLFNEEALKAAQSYEFKNSTGEEQTYLLGVKFEYSEDVCPPGLAPIAPAG
jgi:TonB family protein